MNNRTDYRQRLNETVALQSRHLWDLEEKLLASYATKS